MEVGSLRSSSLFEMDIPSEDNSDNSSDESDNYVPPQQVPKEDYFNYKKYTRVIAKANLMKLIKYDKKIKNNNNF